MVWRSPGSTPAADAGGPATARPRPWSRRREAGVLSARKDAGVCEPVRLSERRRLAAPSPARFGSARRRLCLGPTALDAICAAWSARFTTTCAPPPSERARYGPSRRVTLRPGSPRSGSWAPPNEPPGSPVRMLFRGASRLHHGKRDTRRAELRRAAVVDASAASRVRRDARPPREQRVVVAFSKLFRVSTLLISISRHVSVSSSHSQARFLACFDPKIALWWPPAARRVRLPLRALGARCMPLASSKTSSHTAAAPADTSPPSGRAARAESHPRRGRGTPRHLPERGCILQGAPARLAPVPRREPHHGQARHLRRYVPALERRDGFARRAPRASSRHHLFWSSRTDCPTRI